ncbi:DUF3558 family protein [Saccharopolyspora sp. MS10]|uniref:DUF3558 family protein n=1 Tax=Saccharopolyspora sp. MS10 TaxID=3385973 RepID=UPI0039A1B9F1
MIQRSRSTIAAVCCAGLLAVSGCALGDATTEPEPTSEPKPSGLANFDTCSFFTPADLNVVEASGPGEPVEQVSFEPGCTFEGPDNLLTLYKNQDETVASYETGGNWDSYQKFDINGRAAATGISPGATGHGLCNILLDAGGGVAIVSITKIMPEATYDDCGLAEKVARQIEPRLPR